MAAYRHGHMHPFGGRHLVALQLLLVTTVLHGQSHPAIVGGRREEEISVHAIAEVEQAGPLLRAVGPESPESDGDFVAVGHLVGQLQISARAVEQNRLRARPVQILELGSAAAGRIHHILRCIFQRTVEMPSAHLCLHLGHRHLG